MRENWAPPRINLAPRYVDVLAKRVFPPAPGSTRITEWVWFKKIKERDIFPFAIPIQGLTGPEFFAERTIDQDGNVNYRLRFDNLSPNHPLYEMMKPATIDKIRQN